jgi:hypothetical protein
MPGLFRVVVLLTIIVSFFETAQGSNLFRHLKQTHQHLTPNIDIEGVTNTFICPNESCQRIKQLSLSHKSHLCCQENYLPVRFTMLNIENRPQTTDGFLTQGEFHLIETEQKTQTTCQLIKRYTNLF